MSSISTDPTIPAPGHRSRTSGQTWHELAISRRQRRHGVSLRFRLFLYFVLIVCGSLGATAWLLMQRSDVAGLKLIHSLGRAVGESLATSATTPYMHNDRPTLQRIADEARADSNVELVIFSDAAGKAVVASGATPPTVTPGDRVIISRPIIERKGNTSTVIGQVQIGLGTQLIRENREATMRAVGLVAAGVTVSGVLLSWLFLRCAFRPLKQLMVAAKRVAAGDLDATIEVRDDDGVIGGITQAFNDLVAWIRDHRAQIEATNNASAQAITDLEQKIESRTAQLEAANQRLEGEIAEKEDFLRAVSHDLNAPLRNIGGMVSMLMLKNKDTLPVDVVQRLERIQKNVDVESDLINELLELSRIKTRRQTLDLVDTESLVWELRGMFENDLKTRNIDLVIETSLPGLYAERARLRQVFQNLIDNAIKYMGDGGMRREIRVGCRVTITEAEFYVTDTGLGIHPEDIDKVFCVFRRGRGEVAQKVPGKGVGLASVKSIIETYAGRIWVQSTLGEGTTFRFTMNGKYVPAVSGQVPSEMAGQATQATPTLAA